MSARTRLEDALEHLINEDQEQAVSAFHNFIVEKAREIHSTLLEEDELDSDIDEQAKEEVDENEDEVDESTDEDEAVQENIGQDRERIRSDEYFGREELTTEMDGEEDDMGDMDNMGAMDDAGAEDELDDAGDEMSDYSDDENGEEKQVVLGGDAIEDITDALGQLQATFDQLVNGDEGGDMGDDMGDDDMGDDMGDDYEGDDDGDNGENPFAPEEEPAEESFAFEGKDKDSDEIDEEEEVDEDDEEVDEAVSHEAGVAKKANYGVDPHGKGGNDSLLHNSDAKLPESADDFDFDLTEEDFEDLEEGLKALDIKMGGEQGGNKFAGEETQLKSPVADKDKSDIPVNPQDMHSKKDEHSGYKRETAPSTGSLPHSGDNSKDTGTAGRSEVSGAGGLDKQKGHSASEQGGKKFAGTETNVKSPIGSTGTRTEK